MALPDGVRSRVESYLEAADHALPGFVEGLYVTGSIPLGDYQPAISDVDLVAVCAQRPSPGQLDALRTLHRPSHPSIDVLYLTGDDLAGDPRRLSPPHALNGEFKADGGGNANPVTWRQLATGAIPVRGPQLSEADVWFDADALRAWNLTNLDTYWARWLHWWRGLEPSEVRVRHESGLQWLVLGIPRLHHTIVTLQVISKTAAGRYALGLVDGRWHEVIRTAIELRGDRSAPLRRPVETLHREAGELSAWLIEDAHRQPDG